MPTFIIKRLDQRGGFVAPAGSPKSYTFDRQRARRFFTREAAEREACPENERVIRYEEGL